MYFLGEESCFAKFRKLLDRDLDRTVSSTGLLMWSWYICMEQSVLAFLCLWPWNSFVCLSGCAVDIFSFTSVQPVCLRVSFCVWVFTTDAELPSRPNSLLVSCLLHAVGGHTDMSDHWGFENRWQRRGFSVLSVLLMQFVSVRIPSVLGLKSVLSGF